MIKLLLLCCVIFHNGAAWHYRQWNTGVTSNYYRNLPTFKPVTPSYSLLGTHYHSWKPFLPWNHYSTPPVPYTPKAGYYPQLVPVVLVPMVPLPLSPWGHAFHHYFPWHFHLGHYKYKKIDCNPDYCPVPNIMNGTVLIEKIVNGTLVEGGNATVGSNATFSCDDGFTLVGNETITCNKNSSWNSDIPVCKIEACSTCPPLADPINGAVSPNNTRIGTTVTYTCDDDFQLVGSENRTCDNDCKWSGVDPTCKCTTCPPLADPINGAVSPNNTRIGTTVTYTCDDDFELVGSENRTCGNDCKWSGVDPTCKCTTCPPLADPINGAVSPNNTRIGTTVTYTCDDDFQLVGSENRTCGNDCKWSGVDPTCKCTTCPPLADPINGAVSPNNTRIGTTVTYTCDDDFQLVGSENRTCGNDCKWSGVDPTCKCTTCPPLADPINGAVSPNNTRIGTTVTYTCDDDFQLVGSENRTCGNDCKWSGVDPTCKCTTCPPLADPINGAVSPNNTGIGTTVTYTCDDGFKLIGSENRTCGNDCKWSGDDPTCSCRFCLMFDFPNGYTIPANKTKILSGRTVNLTCDDGFSVSPKQATCTNCTWDVQPVCEPDCIMPNITNALVTGDVSYGSTVKIVCDNGYELCGEGNLTCTKNSTWDPSIPYCVYQYKPDSTVRHFNGSTYIFSGINDLVDFATANKTCGTFCDCDGNCGHLVTICSDEEHNFVASVADSINPSLYWFIGLIGTGTTHEWMHVTGETCTYRNFIQFGDFINLDGACVVMTTVTNGHMWNAKNPLSCKDKTHGYICKIS